MNPILLTLVLMITGMLLMGCASIGVLSLFQWFQRPESVAGTPLVLTTSIKSYGAELASSVMGSAMTAAVVLVSRILSLYEHQSLASKALFRLPSKTKLREAMMSQEISRLRAENQVLVASFQQAIGVLKPNLDNKALVGELEKSLLAAEVLKRQASVRDRRSVKAFTRLRFRQVVPVTDIEDE